MAKVEWTLGGRKVNPRTLKAEFKEGFLSEFLQDVAAVQSDLEDLIRRLNARSTERGRGFYAVRYQSPFQDAEVDVEEVNETTYRIRVKSERKGDSGYIFNVLDAGIPERTSTETMYFPIYSGKLTKPGGEDSFVLNRSNVRVEEPTRWFATKKVGGATPRRFYESILARGKYKNRKQRKLSFGKGFGDVDVRLGVTEFTIVEDK